MKMVMMVNFQPQLEQAAPYEATFRSLRVSTDYSIKISFIIDGHTLGVVDFTIAAEDRSVNYKRAILSKISFSTGDFLPQQHHQDSNPEKNRWHRRLSPEKHRQPPRLSLGDHPQHQRLSHARPQRHRLLQFPLFRRMLTRTLKRRAR